jgi:two-component system, cell cycle response regulator
MAAPLVAVVNDDTEFLDLMNLLLTDQGYQTILHSEGKTAYRMIRQRKPDLVILYLRLEHPEGGWKIMELLRLDPDTTHIPVIVCAADSRATGERRLAS